MRIPITTIMQLCENNQTHVIHEKAKEEASEYLVELCENKDDTALLRESADVIVTMFQVLEKKGLLQHLPETVEKAAQKALEKYFPE